MIFINLKIGTNQTWNDQTLQACEKNDDVPEMNAVLSTWKRKKNGPSHLIDDDQIDIRVRN